ncbi:vam6/Vps39-like protein [Chrysoperla carnea]|uniref:vam6/Vps39-like protein n=1 Tax=Chrysoperla carnea TaxID=189513 RepID=UPI001D07BEF1|nr:vam6/Vps39-like protein [Chrysoperla carnea]
MHEAYEASQILKLSVQIESIAAYDDNLLVGTRQGHLLMYSVTQRSIDQTYDVRLLRYHKTFSKKPIQQLEVIPEYQQLVCLTDNTVSVHDINAINFNLVYSIPKSKGPATLFTLDIKRKTSMTGEISVLVRLCVSVKRKLQLYYWKNNQFLELMQDISLNDVPRAITWCEETVCVGFRGEYTLFELSGKQSELFPTSSNRSSEPCITRISDNIIALGRESQTVLVNNQGSAETNKVLKWSSIPLAMAWDDPYALGLLGETVDIHTVEPCGLIQSLTGLPKARLIVRCKQGFLYAASVTHVWCIKAVDIAKQRQVLLNNKQFQLALKLTSISDETEEDKKQKIYQIQTLYAHDLFANKKFRESMEEFIKLDTDPYDVIRLFPDLLPQQPNDPDTTPAVKLQDKDLENGILALIDYLRDVRRKISVPNSTENSNGSGSASKSALQLQQIIDTTLLKCFLQTNDALVAPLLRLNNCNFSEAEKTLKKYQKYSELIILYQQKKQHKKALDLLEKQANEPDSSLRGHHKTVQYLQNLGAEHINIIFEYAGWVLDTCPEDGLKIFTEDLEKVENLPRPKVLDYLLRTHKDLVIPYLEHVVHVWDDTNSLFHNALIHQYREKEQLLLAENATASEKSAGQHIRNKLLTFLEKSTHYTPDTVLAHFPYDSLYEERAIILGKLGKHQEALSIYVQVLCDIPRAIEYCCNVSEQSGNMSTDENIYVILIKMLLSPTTETLVNAGVGVSGVIPQKTHTPDIETALLLLDKYAHIIPPAKALEVLPDKVSLSRIRHFLETSLRTKLSERRQTQVLKGLLYAEHLQAQELRIMYEKQNILITELNVCTVCKKRFANQSAFVRYPNGDIVHYSCQDRKS